MKNEITLFNNPEFGDVRTFETLEGDVLFCAKDVATALGYKDTRHAISAHCKGGAKYPVPTNGGMQEMMFVPESDVYRLTFSSKLQKAEEFTDWITKEVIPSIRQTGSYSMNDSPAPSIVEKQLEIQYINANARLAEARTEQAKILLEFARLDISPKSKSLLANEASAIVTGRKILPPVETEITYSAAEAGEMLGVTANKIGRIANANGLKTEEYGITILDVAKNGKQVPNFRYNKNGIEKLRELLSA